MGVSTYHRGSGNAVGRSDTADPGANNVLARSEDIDDRTVVGEGGPGVSDGRCADRDRRRGASGGGVDGVRVVVACGDGDMDTLGGQL